MPESVPAGVFSVRRAARMMNCDLLAGRHVVFYRSVGTEKTKKVGENGKNLLTGY